MSQFRIYDCRVNVAVSEERDTDIGKQHIVVGTRTMSVNVYVDMDEVYGLARKAAYAKNRRAKSGPVMARAKAVEEVGEEK